MRSWRTPCQIYSSSHSSTRLPLLIGTSNRLSQRPPQSRMQSPITPRSRTLLPLCLLLPLLRCQSRPTSYNRTPISIIRCILTTQCSTNSNNNSNTSTPTSSSSPTKNSGQSPLRRPPHLIRQQQHRHNLQVGSAQQLPRTISLHILHQVQR